VTLSININCSFDTEYKLHLKNKLDKPNNWIPNYKIEPSFLISKFNLDKNIFSYSYFLIVCQNNLYPPIIEKENFNFKIYFFLY